MLSEEVQVRVIAIFDNHDTPPHGPRQFSESTYTSSNEQAVQNIRVKLNLMFYVEGIDWGGHLNTLNSLTALLAMLNFRLKRSRRIL